MTGAVCCWGRERVIAITLEEQRRTTVTKSTRFWLTGMHRITVITD